MNWSALVITLRVLLVVVLFGGAVIGDGMACAGGPCCDMASGGLACGGRMTQGARGLCDAGCAAAMTLPEDGVSLATAGARRAVFLQVEHRRGVPVAPLRRPPRAGPIPA